MRFEREKDIPELHAKTRKERQAMREQARAQDLTLRKVELLGIVLMLYFTPVADWIAERIRPHSLLTGCGVFLALAVPFALVFRGFFIVPKIRRALGGHAKT